LVSGLRAKQTQKQQQQQQQQTKNVQPLINKTLELAEMFKIEEDFKDFFEVQKFHSFLN